MSVPLGYKMKPEHTAKARASYKKTVTPEYLEKRRRARFDSKLDKKSRPTGCWIWTGAVDKNGYGQTRALYEHVRAHRYAFELSKGTIPSGMMVCHTCDNPPCCNPSHLFIGTAADNNRDMMAKKRHWVPRGENSSHAKLTENDVREIRRIHATGELFQWQIGEQFGVCQQLVGLIASRKRWAFVE